MLTSKEKLSIEIRQVDCVEVDGLDLLKAVQHEILEQLAANAACTDDKHATGANRAQQLGIECLECSVTRRRNRRRHSMSGEKVFLFF